jgi:hypothetical protein
MLDAGLSVVAVESDPATAILAQANLGGRARVICGDARDRAGDLLGNGVAVFADPARRTGAGRTWRVADFSPPWEFVTQLLDGRVGCIKAAPGLPSSFLPDTVAITWVSHRGDLVETSLWSGPWPPGSRTAVLLPSGVTLDAGERRETPVGPVGRYLYEPDPAVIRSGGIAALAERLDARSPQAGIAYLFSDRLVATPFATAFEVHEELPFDERVLRRWVQEHGVGTIEIKVRGLDVDPAALRKRLKPAGAAASTLLLTPTQAGARALVVERTGAQLDAPPAP